MSQEDNLFIKTDEIGENHFVSSFYYKDPPQYIVNYYKKIFSRKSFKERVKEIRELCLVNRVVKDGYAERFGHEVGQLQIDYDMPASCIGFLILYIREMDYRYPVDVVVAKDWDEDERNVISIHISNHTTLKDIKLIWKTVKEFQDNKGKRRSYIQFPEQIEDIHKRKEQGEKVKSIAKDYPQYDEALIRQKLHDYQKLIKD